MCTQRLEECKQYRGKGILSDYLEGYNLDIMGENSTRESKVTVLTKFVTVRSVTISSLPVTEPSSVGSFKAHL